MPNKKLRYWLTLNRRGVPRFSRRTRVFSGQFRLGNRTDDGLCVRGWGWEGDKFVVTLGLAYSDAV